MNTLKWVQRCIFHFECKLKNCRNNGGHSIKYTKYLSNNYFSREMYIALEWCQNANNWIYFLMPKMYNLYMFNDFKERYFNFQFPGIVINPVLNELLFFHKMHSIVYTILPKDESPPR